MFLEFSLSFILLFQKLLSSVAPFIILLGVLVFIHELGHFLIARWCGVKVEVFSLGFGPKIFKFKKGETIYCLSAIPLGGYVKMFGDNPFEEVPDSEKSKGFLYQKVPQKLAIAFGGPLMNLLFTLLAFFALGMMGVNSFSPHLGDIKKGSIAYQKGFRSGDRILSINGNSAQYWSDISDAIRNHPIKNLKFDIQRVSGQKTSFSVLTTSKKNDNIFETKKQIGSIEGLSLLSQGTLIGVSDVNSKAYQYGFRTFDTITHINNKKIKYWRNLESFIRKQNKALVFKVKREEKEIKLKVPSLVSLKSFGIESSALYIDKVGPRTPAFLAGLKRGDRLISINKKILNSWQSVLDEVQSHSGTSPFLVRYKRNGKILESSIKPKKMIVEGQLKERFMIGIGSSFSQIFPEERVQSFSFIKSINYSLDQTWKWLGVITMGIVRLTQKKISFRTMGGPVAIGRVAHSSFNQGFNSFIWIMALISLNLFFFNLLPIPLLDGGHILFFTLEGLIGRPLNPRKIFVAQQIGVLILFSFFGFVLFNDFYNWFNAW